MRPDLFNSFSKASLSDNGHWQVNSSGGGCAILALRLNKTSAGIAGKDFGEIRGLWPETAIAFPTASSAIWIPAQIVADPAKKTRWLLWLEDTSNGRVSPCSSSASKPIAMLIKRNHDASASLHLFALHLHRSIRNILDYRNS
jgi:hypothetical protein